MVNPQGLGVRQPSAAFPPPARRTQSGRGLPHSKTLARDPINPRPLSGYSICEPALENVGERSIQIKRIANDSGRAESSASRELALPAHTMDALLPAIPSAW